MSKIVYPSEGILSYCRQHIDGGFSNLRAALSYCNFDVPSDFSLRNYLNNLENVVGDYNQELSDINFKIQNTHNNYVSLDSDMETSVKKMTNIKIKDRDRMIV